MNPKSAGILMLIVLFGVAFYFLLPNMKGMKETSVKKSIISSAQIYGDEVKSLWNSDAIYCENGTNNYRSIVALPHGEYYAVIGKSEVNPNLPVIKIDKVKDNYYGYVKIDYTNVTPEYSVFLTDGTYSVNSNNPYSSLTKKDVKEEKLSFTYDSSYHYCKGDQV